MLSIYLGRTLLFVGDPDAARAAGVRLHMAAGEVTIGGRRRRIVNNHLTPDRVSFWVA